MKKNVVKVGDVLVCTSDHDEGCCTLILGLGEFYTIALTYDFKNRSSCIHSWKRNLSYLPDWNIFGWTRA